MANLSANLSAGGVSVLNSRPKWSGIRWLGHNKFQTKLLDGSVGWRLPLTAQTAPCFSMSSSSFPVVLFGVLTPVYAGTTVVCNEARAYPPPWATHHVVCALSTICNCGQRTDDLLWWGVSQSLKPSWMEYKVDFVRLPTCWLEVISTTLGFRVANKPWLGDAEEISFTIVQSPHV